jgi:hypothetical protein
MLKTACPTIAFSVGLLVDNAGIKTLLAEVLAAG